MPVGELFISAFLQVLFDRLAPHQLPQLPLRKGIRLKLQKWEQKLRMIQAVLSDAEKRQLDPENTAVKVWLDDLRDLAYDIEDILDEFATEVLGRKLTAERVQNLIPACFTGMSPRAIKFSVSMSSKIEDITSRLEQLCKTKADLGLKEISGGPSTAPSPKLESTSVPTEPAVYGRDADKANILEIVLKDGGSNANFHVIAIIGMGGIGKTTLAREVFNDKAVESFSPKKWVCVSDNFDIRQISLKFLMSITENGKELKNITSLDDVYVKLRKNLAGKKFLFVLDDVWNKDGSLWESLKSPMMIGAAGSKIIITTRDKDVASKIGCPSIDFYNLGLLHDDDCWSVVVKHASNNRDIDLDRFREKVIEKCKGLPLAARTLGSLLLWKQIDEWEDILSSRIWDLSEKDDDILNVLKLSYHHLPSHLKRCFAYCAIIPKDYEFLRKDLILLWMAEGLIQVQQSNHDNKQPEIIGEKYFEDLLSRSIFQYSNDDGSRFVMHDLINDLAQWASGEMAIRLEDDSRVNNHMKSFNKVRYFSYIFDECNNKNTFEVFHEAENLRTFLHIFLGNEFHYLTNFAFSKSLPKLKKLRVLSLGNYKITKLPNSIGNLKHLRYLNLSQTEITSLPKSIGLLFNLLVLILSYCWNIKRLPPMNNLINLRHLDIEGVNLKMMPVGMESWKYLQTLSNFIVGKDSGSHLKVLKNLVFLRGKLCISELKNVTDLQDQILFDKKNLNVLLLRWRDDDEDLPSTERGEKENEVLEMLRPHNNLKKLSIESYGGTRLSTWVGNSSFSKMTDLNLYGCENCTTLPSLGSLDSLKNLTIVCVTRLKRIGDEFYGKDPSKSFPSLETLRFDNLFNWERWDSIKDNEYAERFPRLRELFIAYCPKLSGSLPDHLPSLEKLHIYRCSQLAVSFYHLPSLQKLAIKECAKLKVGYSTFPMLRELDIRKCKEIVCSTPIDCNSLTSMGLPNISQIGNLLSWQGFQTIEQMRIVDCDQVIMPWGPNEICPQRPPQRLHNLTSLRKLFIENCSSFVSFPEANALRTLAKLVIVNCNSVKRVVIDRLPSALTELSIDNCEKLQYLLDDEEDVGTSSVPSASVMHRDNIDKSSVSGLEYLTIFRCPSLTCLSSKGQLPTTLKKLQVFDCSELTVILLEGQLPEALEFLDIWYCPTLELIAERFHNNKALKNIGVRWCDSLKVLPNGFHSLNSLQDLTIEQCPSIVTFPQEGLPTNLTSLTINAPKIYNLLIEWGLHKLTSLTSLRIDEGPDVICFLPEGMLPPSLTELNISGFPQLKYLSSNDFQNLTSLQILEIYNCPSLASFPSEGLPSSVVYLDISGCPLLQK